MYVSPPDKSLNYRTHLEQIREIITLDNKDANPMISFWVVYQKRASDNEWHLLFGKPTEKKVKRKVCLRS